MAVINALKSGNWSDPSVWPNNTFPGLNDEVHANGFAVTLNINVTVAELTTAAKNGGGAGGGFTLTNNVTVTANLVAGTTTCLTAASTCLTAAVVGNVTGGSVAGGYGLYLAGTAQVKVIGKIAGGSGVSAHGAYITASTNLTVEGIVSGGSGPLAAGICAADAALVTLDGSTEFSALGQSPLQGNIRFKRRDTIAFNILTDSGMMQLRPCPYTDQPVINLPAPQTGQAVAWVKCIDQTGAPVAGVPVSIQHVDGGKSGVIHISQPLTGVSDNNGLTTFAIPRIAGLKYQLWTEGKSVKKLFVSKDAESYEIPVSVITEAKEFGQK